MKTVADLDQEIFDKIGRKGNKTMNLTDYYFLIFRATDTFHSILKTIHGLIPGPDRRNCQTTENLNVCKF